MNPVQAEADHDRRGRPRSAEADQAILDATIEEFAEHGYDGLTVEAVAARAGVGKATIYRRYCSKVDLVLAAAAAVAEQTVPVPDTGTVRGDLRSIAGNLVRLLTEGPIGRTSRMIVAEMQRNPELAGAHRDFIARRRRGTELVVRRGIERGELRRGTEPAIVADLLSAPVFYRHLMTGDPLDAPFLDAVVDAIVTAYGT